MKKILKKIFNIAWHVLVAIAFCGFIVLPFLHNAIDKTLGIVEVDSTVWKKLSDEEKEKISIICDKKLHEYYERIK